MAKRGIAQVQGLSLVIGTSLYRSWCVRNFSVIIIVFVVIVCVLQMMPFFAWHRLEQKACMFGSDSHFYESA